MDRVRAKAGEPHNAPDPGMISHRYSPADESELVSTHNLIGPDAAAPTINAAVRTQSPWAAQSGPDRARVLHRVADVLTDDLEAAANEITAEAGKLLSDARVEVSRAVDTLRVAAEYARAGRDVIADSDEPGTVLYTRRKPLGVVALITPCNFPLGIPVRKAAYALAAGNAVVLKPSLLTITPALRLAHALERAGLPAGCFEVLVGGDDVGERLVNSEAIAGVSFTGSTAAGFAVARSLASPLIPLQAEMGGLSPLVVLDDADLDIAVKAAIAGAFRGAGQTCTATRHIFATRRVYDQFLTQLTSAALGLKLGAGWENDAVVPPLATVVRRDEALQQVDCAVDDGASVHLAPEIPAHLVRGAFMSPTILVDVPPGSYAMCTEIFAPVVTVVKVDDLDHGLAAANSSSFGLSAALITRSERAAREFTRRIDAGMIHVNRPTIGSDAHMPFGGMKASAIGPREQSSAGFEFFSRQQTVFTHPI